MNRSNYAAERANQAEELPPLPEVIYLDVEEITLHDLTPAQQKAEYKQLLTADEFENDYLSTQQIDEDDDDDQGHFTFTASTNTYENGFDPFELDTDSCHRAFCNNFGD